MIAEIKAIGAVHPSAKAQVAAASSSTHQLVYPLEQSEMGREQKSNKETKKKAALSPKEKKDAKKSKKDTKKNPFDL